MFKGRSADCCWIMETACLLGGSTTDGLVGGGAVGAKAVLLKCFRCHKITLFIFCPPSSCFSPLSPVYSLSIVHISAFLLDVRDMAVYTQGKALHL